MTPPTNRPKRNPTQSWKSRDIAEAEQEKAEKRKADKETQKCKQAAKDTKCSERTSPIAAEPPCSVTKDTSIESSTKNSMAKTGAIQVKCSAVNATDGMYVVAAEPPSSDVKDALVESSTDAIAKTSYGMFMVATEPKAVLRIISTCFLCVYVAYCPRTFAYDGGSGSDHLST